MSIYQTNQYKRNTTQQINVTDGTSSYEFDIDSAMEAVDAVRFNISGFLQNTASPLGYKFYSDFVSNFIGSFNNIRYETGTPTYVFTNDLENTGIEFRFPKKTYLQGSYNLLITALDNSSIIGSGVAGTIYIQTEYISNDV